MFAVQICVYSCAIFVRQAADRRQDSGRTANICTAWLQIMKIYIRRQYSRLELRRILMQFPEFLPSLGVSPHNFA
jgi:hypothetical protein